MENRTNDLKNLIFAIVLSAIALFGIEAMFPSKDIESVTNKINTKTELSNTEALKPTPSNIEIKPELSKKINPDDFSKRIKIETDKLTGSIRLVGGRIDDLKLKGYTNSVEDDTLVTLLSPENSEKPYFIDIGYSSHIKNADIPNDTTVWSAGSDTLEVEKPLVLTYINNKGLIFKRTYSIDKNYMITVFDRIENKGKESAVLFPYGLISKTGYDKDSKSSGHEGVVAYLGDKLQEKKYSDLTKEDKNKLSFDSVGGWSGFGDKYWLTALVYDQETKGTTVNMMHRNVKGLDIFQTDYLLAPKEIEPNETITFKTLVFAGAKEIEVLDKYTEELGVPRFDLAIDFGWYYFLTKPFLYILNYFHKILGNMGLAILLFAFLLRLAMYPIASKSFENMSKMKKLHPMINEVNEKYKGDQVRINQEIMAIYKREKVNPAAGCLPMFIQIPIFFSLYKVLYIAIEMRQAPFYGWINDLSMPDPTSVFTLFGLVNWDVPAMINIGAWPILMGVTMFIQQKLNPAPNDKTQAKIFMLLPILFTFTLSKFAAGLVIYWAWSNVLSIVQQKFIYMKMEKN